jgi:hypothetical protein
VWNTDLGTFEWPPSLEADEGDVPVGVPVASATWPRSRSWLPGGHAVKHVLAARFNATDKALVFMCKLRGYALDDKKHWYRGVMSTGGRGKGWMTGPSGPAATAPAALTAFLGRYPDVAAKMRGLLAERQAKNNARGAAAEAASGAPAIAPAHGTEVDGPPVRARPRAAAATARAALRSLAVAEAAHKHPLLAATIRAQAAAGARREAVHPLVAIRRACVPTPPTAAGEAPTPGLRATSVQRNLDALSADSW